MEFTAIDYTVTIDGKRRLGFQLAPSAQAGEDFLREHGRVYGAAGHQRGHGAAQRPGDMEDEMTDYNIAQALAEAIEATRRSEEGAAMDAGFDAGEFSGPAHARMRDAELDRIAPAHGITRDALDSAMQKLAGSGLDR